MSRGLARVGVGRRHKVVVIEEAHFGLCEVKNPLQARIFGHLIVEPSRRSNITVVVVEAVKAVASQLGRAQGVAELSCGASERQKLTIGRAVAAFQR